MRLLRITDSTHHRHHYLPHLSFCIMGLKKMKRGRQISNNAQVIQSEIYAANANADVTNGLIS